MIKEKDIESIINCISLVIEGNHPKVPCVNSVIYSLLTNNKVEQFTRLVPRLNNVKKIRSLKKNDFDDTLKYLEDKRVITLTNDPTISCKRIKLLMSYHQYIKDVAFNDELPKTQETSLLKSDNQNNFIKTVTGEDRFAAEIKLAEIDGRKEKLVKEVYDELMLAPKNSVLPLIDKKDLLKKMRAIKDNKEACAFFDKYIDDLAWQIAERNWFNRLKIEPTVDSDLKEETYDYNDAFLSEDIDAANLEGIDADNLEVAEIIQLNEINVNDAFLSEEINTDNIEVTETKQFDENNNEFYEIFKETCEEFIENKDLESFLKDYEEIKVNKLLSEEELSNECINVIKRLIENDQQYNDSIYVSTIYELLPQNYELPNEVELLLEDYNNNIDKLLEKISTITHKIYVSDRCRKSIKQENKEEILSEINQIIRILSIERHEKLIEFLKAHNYEYLFGTNIKSIRVKGRSRTPQRLCFVWGEDINKNAGDIYLVEYLPKHNYKDLDNIKVDALSYELYNPRDFLIYIDFKPDKKQEAIISSNEYPLVCTGCAGAGKTLIGVKKCINLAFDLLTDRSSKLTTNELVYITYSQKLSLESKKHLSYFLKEYELNEEAVSTFYLEEFFRIEIAKREIEQKIINEKEFKEWFIKNYKNQINGKQKQIYTALNKEFRNPELVVWSFFRGVYKGSLFGWQENKKRVDMLHMSEKDFKDAVGTRSVFGNNKNYKIDSIRDVWEICKDFQNYMTQNNLIDYNDLARISVEKYNNRKQDKFNLMVIDEVQDLTEVELNALISLSKDYEICFFGDTNQSINPTIFKINRIQSCFNSINNKILVKKNEKLSETYRIKPDFIDYINHLIDVRKEWLKAGDDDSHQQSKLEIDEDGRANCQITNKEIIDNAIESILQNPRGVIVFSNQEAKEEFISNYPSAEGNYDRLFTIFEIKGLEEEYVLVYNLIKDNEELFVQMKNNKVDSIVHRMIFNQLYVACTRAKKSLIIAEMDLNDDLKKELLPTNLLVEVNALEDLTLYVQNEPVTPEIWIQIAEQHFYDRQYERASREYEKSGNPDYIEKSIFCKQLADYTSKSIYERDEKAKEEFIRTIINYGKPEGYSIGKELFEHDDYAHKYIFDILLNKEVSEESFMKLIKECDLSNDEIIIIKETYIYKKIRELTKEKFKNLGKKR